LATGLLVLVGEVGLGGADEGSKIALILALDLLESNNGSGLLVDDCPKTGLALDDDIGDTHLAAKGREEDNELNGVNIVSDDNESSLLGLDERDDVVETVLGVERLGGLDLLLLGNGGGGGLKTSLLFEFALRAVLVEELEELSSRVLVEGVRELGNGGGDLETLVEDDLLALEADVFGPLDEAGQIALGLDILTDTEVLSIGLEERILLGFGDLAGTEGG